ncbi:MAG: glycosyltransferase [Christiangramia sp.]|nr:glycosyltransferase [Christiangramia sp.]
MKISHVINSIDNSTGGPARSVTSLLESILQKSDLNVDLYSGKSDNPIISDFIKDRGEVQFFGSNFTGHLKGLDEKLKISKPDLMHGHGLWQMPIHQMAVTARKLGVPYIISPRGMLDVWSINHKGFKKKLALKLYQRKDLEFASGFHATSKVEAENIRKAGFENPIAIIPNGVKVPEIIKKTYLITKKRKILFLSRLVKNKGIEELLVAWSRLDLSLTQNWELNIVGSGDKEYVKKLNEKKVELNLPNVQFRGAAYSEDKENYFFEADLFVLPTYTENFGVAIAEALAYGIPVITTKGAPWSDLIKNNCGWWIDLGEEPLRISLIEALSSSQESLNQMGENGRKLIQDKYSLDSVSEKMKEFYDWIKSESKEKPNFIFEN